MAETNMPELHTKKIVDDSSRGTIKSASTFRKLARIFITDDPEQAAKNWAEHVMKPMAKRTVFNAIASFTSYVTGNPALGNALLNFTTAWNSNSTLNSGTTSNTPYYMYGNGAQPPANTLVSQPPAVTGGARFNGTVFFQDYQTAANVLEELHRVLREYKIVRLLELYDAANIPGIEYVSNNWGWRDLTGATIYPSGNGYILQLPPMIVLN